MTLLCGYRPSPWSFLSNPGVKLGFVALGVTNAGRLPKNAIENYQAWLNRRFHGGMSYLENHFDQRIDTSHPQIVKNATIVICAALPYGNGSHQEGLFKHIASHARGVDYHLTMKTKLAQLAEVIKKEHPSCEYRVFTDSAPVMERSLAVLAGLGQIGRHGGLIVPGYGARVVLGEIICRNLPPLDEDAHQKIDRDQRLTPHCRSCNKCVKACPTGAIGHKGSIDSNRCLSYTTIENRSADLEEEYSKNIELVFGCDHCTQVCPLETFSNCQLAPLPNNPLSKLDLNQVLQSTNSQLNKALKRTALERTGAKTIKRNARYILQNQAPSKPQS